MFKMILSAVVALGLGSVAFADDHGKTAPAAPADPAMTAPAPGNEEMPADAKAAAKGKKAAKKAGKKEHGAGH